MCFWRKNKGQGSHQRVFCEEISSRLLALTEHWQSEVASEALKVRLSTARERIKKIVFPRSDGEKIAGLYRKVIKACEDLVSLGVTGERRASTLDEQPRTVAACVQEIESAVAKWEEVR